MSYMPKIKMHPKVCGNLSKQASNNQDICLHRNGVGGGASDLILFLVHERNLALESELGMNFLSLPLLCPLAATYFHAIG